jgi:hypothetical protein
LTIRQKPKDLSLKTLWKFFDFVLSACGSGAARDLAGLFGKSGFDPFLTFAGGNRIIDSER